MMNNKNLFGSDWNTMAGELNNVAWLP